MASSISIICGRGVEVVVREGPQRLTGRRRGGGACGRLAIGRRVGAGRMAATIDDCTLVRWVYHSGGHTGGRSRARCLVELCLIRVTG